MASSLRWFEGLPDLLIAGITELVSDASTVR